MDALYCAAAIGLNLTTSACVAGARADARPRWEAVAAMGRRAGADARRHAEQALDASSIA
ncbi:MAG: hypothetical protein ACLS89_06040 [Collinsella sp.]